MSSTCKAKDPSTCRFHGQQGQVNKTEFYKQFLPSNVTKIPNLSLEEQLYLTEQLSLINESSSSYKHDYENEEPVTSREGELEFLQNYDPTKYGVDPDSVSQTADNIIFTKGDDGRLKILLVQRGDHPFKNYWCHPGGFIDDGESSQEAAARELEEETGMKLPAESMLFIKKYNHPWRDPRMKNIQMKTHVTYLPVIPKFESGDDASDVKLVDVEKLYTTNEPKLGFDHKQSIADSIRFLLQ